MALYLVILDTSLKFLVDANPGSQSRMVFYIFGLAIIVGGVGLEIYAIRLYLPMVERSSKPANLLDVGNVLFRPALNTAKVLMGFVVIALLAWMSLFFIR